MVNWKGYIWPRYMCILLYVKLIWCSGITQIYGQLEEGAFVYLHSAISETYLVQWLFHRYMVNWRREIHLPWVYVHSSIRETYLVQWYSIDLWSIGGGVHLALGICAFCYMLNLFGVVVFHRSMVNWKGYIWPRYICILLYVKLIWCSGIPQIYGQLEGGYISPGYMYFLLHVKLICCSDIPQIYGQLEEGSLGICAFCYI